MKIRITPGALLLFLALALERDALLPAALFAAAVHEAGHLAAARALGVRLRLLELDTFGARIEPCGALPSYRAEALLAAGGPAASGMLALFFAPFGGEWALTVRTVTLSLGIFNLLPVAGFDGGRILDALLLSRFDTRAAARALAATSYLSLLFLFSLSACLLLRFGQNLTLAVLSASLFARLFLKNDR